MRRIELLTPCLQGRCSPSWATPPNLTLYCVKCSLPYNSTACVALPCLSSNWLSHSLLYFSSAVKIDAVWIFFDATVYFVYTRLRKNPKCAILVGLSGLEPPTSRLSGVRSNRLSYRPMQGFTFASLLGFPFLFLYQCICYTLKNKQPSLVLSTFYLKDLVITLLSLLLQWLLLATSFTKRDNDSP